MSGLLAELPVELHRCVRRESLGDGSFELSPSTDALSTLIRSNAEGKNSFFSLGKPVDSLGTGGGIGSWDTLEVVQAQTGVSVWCGGCCKVEPQYSQEESCFLRLGIFRAILSAKERELEDDFGFSMGKFCSLSSFFDIRRRESSWQTLRWKGYDTTPIITK